MQINIVVTVSDGFLQWNATFRHHYPFILSRDGLIDVHDDAVTLNNVGKLRQFAHGESHKLSG